MKMKKWLSAAVVITALGGCAQYQQRQAAMQYQQNMSAARDNVNLVCKDSYKQPAIDIVRDQVPADARKATVAQLSDTRLPTPAQRDVIANFESLAAPCIQATANFVQLYAPYATQALDQETQESKFLLAKMYGGHMTFGEFNQERSKISSEFAKEAYAAQNKYRSQQQQNAIQQQQLNIQREQAEIAAQQAYHPYVQKPYIMPVPRSTTTNCYNNGVGVTCTTQ